MNHRLHPITTFFTITTLLATLILSQETQPYYDTCSQSVKCGNLNLEYPFWGFGRPEYCGHPRFQLTCQSDVPIIAFESVSYRVIDTDTTTHTITIARNDLWDNICPTSLHNTSYDTTLFNGDNSDQEDVSLFYGCRDNLPGPGDEPLNTSFRFSCGRDSYGYFYRTDLIPSDTVNLLVECDDGIVVPVNRSSADRLASVTATEGDLRSALKGGFSLEWKANNEDCDRCVRSDGKCGSNSTSPELFACYEGAGGNSKSRPSHIVFAIVGSAIVVVCIGCGIFVWIRLRKRRAIKEAPYTQTKSRAIFTTGSSHGLTSDNSTFTASSISSFPSSKTSDTFIDIGKSTYFGAQVFTYEELQLATNNFNDSRELGDGGFGTVYFGKLLDGREVAVKRLYENNFRRVEQFINEVRILTGLHHENLVKLHGCTSKRSRELLLVYEYIPNGTVADHLHGKLANPSSSLLSWPVRLNIAIQTAEALAYLHKSAVIHRDVKTNNILLDKSFQVKVADFGLSRLFENVTHVSTAPQGTPGYVDPEYYQCYQLTDKSDVYSFGVVLIELISSLQAVDISRNRHDINLSNMAVSMIQSRQLDELVDKSVGFERDGSVRKNVTLVAELAFRCLQQEKDLRPTMQEVMDNLREIQNDELNDQKPEVVDIVVDYGDLLKGHNSESTSANSGVN